MTKKKDTKQPRKLESLIAKTGMSIPVFANEVSNVLPDGQVISTVSVRTWIENDNIPKVPNLLAVAKVLDMDMGDLSTHLSYKEA